MIKEQRGSAVVEFALTLPLVLLVALALAQVAVVGRDRIVLQHAARAGARLAAVETSDQAVDAEVRRAAAWLDPDDLTVMVQRVGGLGEPVAVRAEYDVPMALPLAGWLLPPAVHLSAEVTMRQEFG